MRPGARAMETRAPSLTRRRDHPFASRPEGRWRQAISGCAVAVCVAPSGRAAWSEHQAIVWTENPVRTPGKIDKPL